MALDSKVTKLMEKALAKVDDQGIHGSRLMGDARRLYGRILKFIDLGVVTDSIDPAPLELACLALQLPLRTMKVLPSGKLGRTNIRDRAEQAAELLVTLSGGNIDEALLDRTTQLLHQFPQKSPSQGEARLLADAVNLEDFGATGLLSQAIQLCRTGCGVTEIVDGQEKREQYGYWEVRLKDGFHFEPIRRIARQRLEHSRRVTALLLQEMKEDRAV